MGARMTREMEIATGRSTAELVNAVHMTVVDRRDALAALQRAEAIADVLHRATEAVEAAVEAGMRGGRGLAQRVRAMLAKPVQL